MRLVEDGAFELVGNTLLLRRCHLQQWRASGGPVPDSSAEAQARGQQDDA